MSVGMSYRLFVPIALVATLTALVLFAADVPPSHPSTIAVLNFKNLQPNAATDWIGEGAAETLTTRLASIAGLVTVERTQIRKVLDEQVFQQIDLTDPRSAVKLGKTLGAQRMVVGTYVSQTDGLMFNARVVDVASGEVLSTAQVIGDPNKALGVLFQVAEAIVQSFERKSVTLDARQLTSGAGGGGLGELEKAVLNNGGTLNTDAFQAFSSAGLTRVPDEQINWLNRAIQLDPNYAMAFHMRGVAYAWKGNHDRAIQDFTRALELRPTYSWAPASHYERGNAFARKGDYARALQDVTRATELSPTYADAFVSLGSIYRLQGDLDRAIAGFSRAVELRPNYTGVYQLLGACCFQKNDFDAALKHFGRAIQLSPKDASGYENRATVYAMKGDNDRAVQDATRAIELGANTGAAYYVRGAAYSNRKDYDRAIRDLNRAVELNPNDWRSVLHRANAHYKKRAYDKAWADVRECRRLGGEVDAKFLADLVKDSKRTE